MPPRIRDCGDSLPRTWPRRVRSAIVHAISMANAAFLTAVGHARTRLRAENDLLVREMSLLRKRSRDGVLLAGPVFLYE